MGLCPRGLEVVQETYRTAATYSRPRRGDVGKKLRTRSQEIRADAALREGGSGSAKLSSHHAGTQETTRCRAQSQNLAQREGGHILHVGAMALQCPHLRMKKAGGSS